MSAILMMIGGAMGSTAGGIKQVRVASVFKGIYNTLFDRLSSKRIIRSHFLLRYGEEKEYTNDYFNESVSYLLLYLLLLFVGTLLITFMPAGVTFGDAFYEVASAMSGTGLSSGVTYASQHVGVLWVLSVVMFLGRLEIIVVYYAGSRVVRDIFRKETV